MIELSSADHSPTRGGGRRESRCRGVDQALCLRRGQARHGGRGARAAAARKKPPCPIQVPAVDRVRERAAEDSHRQGPAVQVARVGCPTLNPSRFLCGGGRKVGHQWSEPPAAAADRPVIVMLHEGLGSVVLAIQTPRSASGNENPPAMPRKAFTSATLSAIRRSNRYKGASKAPGHEPRVFRIRTQAMRFPDGMGCSPCSSEMKPFAS